MAFRSLVVDANVLIRSVFGVRARRLSEQYSTTVKYRLPYTALAEAERRVPEIALKRRSDPVKSQQLLLDLALQMSMVSAEETYWETDAKRRLKRDPSDWPILAAALELNCPIWTDDRDFFGCGVATWNTANVEIYLAGEDQPRNA